jgi:hypothetical protein
MGADAADYNRDGHFGVVVTHFSHDYTTLYENSGRGFFTDASYASGVAAGAGKYLGWGVGFVDFENSGLLDLFVANGHIYPEVDTHGLGTRYRQRKQVFRNLGNKRFQEVTDQAGAGVLLERSSRGAAFGDYDNDGDIDILVLNLSDPPSLLRNDGGNSKNWIKIKLVGTKCNRTAIGARVRVITGTHIQMDEVHSGSSVMSQCDLRLHFGLGKALTVDVIEVKWPTTQKIERFTQVKANQILTIREGSGIVETTKPKAR